MKKICCCILVLLIAVVTLTACGEYVNNYSATIMSTKTINRAASMKFETFKGTYNFKLRNNYNDIKQLAISFRASLAVGKINVYVGVDGERELLVTLKGGETIQETKLLDEKYNNQKTIYIIIEATEKCSDGDFDFNMFNLAEIEDFDVPVGGGVDIGGNA